MEEYKDHIDQELFEQIEAYLLNTLSPEERSRFEKQLAADPSLQKELDLQRQLLAIATIESFKTDQQAKPTLPAKVKPISKWWWAAAAMLVLISGIWYLQSKSVSPQQLANHYFIPDPGLPVTMSSTRQYQFYDGMVSYKEADYDKALSIWKSIAQNNNSSDTVQYFIGVAYLNTDQYNDALQQLLPIAEGKGKWKDKAAWYLSITYLKLNQPKKAANWLKTIPSYPEANELLEELNQSNPEQSP